MKKPNVLDIVENFKGDALRTKYFARYDEDLLTKFKVYHLERPEIYAHFEGLAISALGKRAHYSANMIMARLRWDYEMGEISISSLSDNKDEAGNTFKINDEFTSIYARVLAIRHPVFQQFFTFKHNYRPKYKIEIKTPNAETVNETNATNQC